MPPRLTYLHLAATDAQRSARFYEAALGWSIEDRGGGDFRFASEALQLIGRWSPATSTDPALAYYYVENVADAIARVTEYGGEVVTAPRLEGDTLIATLRDPAGNALGIWQFAAAGKVTTGYATIGALRMYYEIRGAGEPLVVLHGGLGSTGLHNAKLDDLAAKRRVIAVDLQAHGRTGDIDRPLRFELMADDIAALARELDLPHIDLAGYSLGGGVAARVAIQHPALVRKLALVATPVARRGSYPDVLAGMATMSAKAAEGLKQSPVYASYRAIAPRVEDFPRLCEKLGDLLRRDYDWSADFAKLVPPALIMFADADSIPPRYAAEMYALLGGGERDAGWDGKARPRSQLAIIPNATHYDVFQAPPVAAMLEAFFAAG